jgi:hypothetical protein
MKEVIGSIPNLPVDDGISGIRNLAILSLSDTPQ